MILETLVAVDVALSTLVPSRVADDPVLILAGDVHAECDGRGDDATASMVQRMAGTVISLGDMAHDGGTAAEYADCYAPSWGRLLDRTKVVAGNHDWESGGAPFLSYFAGSLGQSHHPTYYAFDRGRWRLYVLDSNCDVVHCGRQLSWLRGQLRNHPRSCVAAFYHHPTHSSSRGAKGGYPETRSFLDALAAAGAEVVVSAHRHGYERFARIAGVRQLVVATGGSSRWHRWAPVPQPGSQVRIGHTWGVATLTLRDTYYQWSFIDINCVVSDTGSTRCST